jgi:hypothetical protein
MASARPPFLVLGEPRAAEGVTQGRLEFLGGAPGNLLPGQALQGRVLSIVRKAQQLLILLLKAGI